jgi:hypothetical protein
MTRRKLHFVERSTILLLVSTNVTRIQMSNSGSTTVQVHSQPHPLTTSKLQTHNVSQFLCSEFLIVLWSTTPIQTRPPSRPLTAGKLQTLDAAN